MPPIGIGYLAATLERDGFQVKIIDANAEGLSSTEVVQRLSRYAPRVVGISSTSVNIQWALKLAREIKEYLPQSLVVLGGIHATVDPDYILTEPAGRSGLSG